MITSEHYSYNRPVAKKYEEKRDFSRTPEPPLRQPSESGGPLTFVVQKHSARRLHYDFRLELDGVLKSWAVPAGPSADTRVRRLAVMVEDHPLDYASFEGIIPEGEYGGGQVIVWDRGTYSPEEDGRLFFDDRERSQKQMRNGLAQDKVSVFLRGQKLKGSWTLVKTKRGDWLLIKHKDKYAQSEYDILDDGKSVISGLSIEDLKARSESDG